MDGIETARRRITEEQEKPTGFLDLGNLQLTEVSEEVFALTHLLSEPGCMFERQAAEGFQEILRQIGKTP
ncbi:MAG: hypothetical protein FJZ47_04785 [Candidatus Tectomicrobia bacterium]|uniref:Uncharacterized protein n=1 Tax=Tectimicrobiota bacterium TaxID=2528274 RepID=A0A937W0R7_UNCTE|nr:hypothetical protein [Candidatus Tectomicrobia bacterium]